jgi:hypothetical protein
MTKFTKINYGNDWGVFVDIESDNFNYFNNDHVVCINNYESAKIKNKYNYNYNQLICTITINLFVCGYLAYIIYFVL